MITSVPYASGNVNYGTATNDTGVNPSCDSGSNTDARQGVWWTYTPAASGVINLAQIASPSQDTATSIWTGACGALTQVACSDPEASTFNATAGVQYYILISKWNTTNATAGSNVAFTLTLPPPVIAQTDTCAAPTVISSLPFGGTMPVDTATDDTNINPSCDSTSNTAGAKQGVWFSYTAGPSGAGLLLSETGSQDIVITAWSGASCAALTQVLCSDAESNISLSVPPNTTYLICVAKWSSTSYATGNTITLTVTAPLAACCSNTTGACTLTATACGAGTTTATGTTCAPDPCLSLIGACCSTTAGTCSNTLAAGCTSPSVFQGAGAACTPNPCGGACCSTSGTCTVSTATACTSPNTFQGLGSACSPNPCGGACCNTASGVCTSSTATLCVGANTNFLGLGSVCSPNPCAGACCSNATAACSITVAAGCGSGSTFLGNGTVCSPNPCPSGRCCVNLSGFCSVTGPAGCTNPLTGTTYTAGQTCSAACTAPTSQPNDDCLVTQAAPNHLTGHNVTFYSTTVGSTTPAQGFGGNGPSGTTFGCATGLTLAASNSGSDVFFSFIPDVTGPFDISVCTTFTAGNDTVMDIHTGCPATNTNIVDCNDDGNCNGGVGPSRMQNVNLTAGTPYVIRVSHYGTSSTAKFDFVLSITGDPVGSCCLGDGSCAVQTLANCSTAGGSGWVQGQICNTTVVCTGACCNNSSAACTTTGSAQCSGGVFQGIASTCTPSPCPGGACCNPDSALCTFTGPNGCSSPNTYQGTGSTCSPNPCPGGACCDFIAGTCSFSGPTGCIGGSYQGTGTSCTPNPCSGACCDVTTAACTVTGTGGCASPSVFQGAGSVCSPLPCPGGACCTPASGACTFTGNAAGCGSGTFQGLGSSCTPNPCPVPPGQACSSPIVISLNSPLAGDLANSALNSTITCSSGVKGLWYSFTAPADGSYLFSSTLTTGTGNPSLGLFNPDCTTQIACDNPCGGTLSTSTQTMTSGQQIIFRAGGCADTQLTWSVSVTAVANGACCNATSGACSITGGATACGTANFYQGDNTTCPGSGLCNPIGACCNDSTGVCTLIYGGSCAAGSHAASGTVCDTNTCPVVAACCSDADGTCTLIYGGSCAAGTHAAAGLVCDSSSCPIAGSCCNGVTGACALTYVASCTSPLTFNSSTTCGTGTCTAGPHICENFDGSGSLPAGWTTTSSALGAPWAIATDQSNSPTNAVFTNDVASVSSQFLVMPAVTAGGTLTVDFWSYYTTESTFDGFVVEYSTDAGATWTDIGAAGWALNGYTATISNNFASPIAGRQAFTGAHATWTEHVGSIPASAGQSVIVRFHMASDQSVASTGVWLDDICIGGNQVVNPGVCCRGSTCSSAFATATACAAATTTSATGGPGWAFVTSALPCNAGVNADGTYSGALTSTTSPCCFANYNHNAGLEVQDIFDFLNDWFAGRPIAIPGGDGTSNTGLAVQNIFNFLNAWFAGGCN